MRGFSRNIVNYYPLEYPVESEEKKDFILISTVVSIVLVGLKF